MHIGLGQPKPENASNLTWVKMYIYLCSPPKITPKPTVAFRLKLLIGPKLMK